jgi:hypothetical protein
MAALQQQLDVKQQQGQGQQQFKTKPTGEIGNVSIQSKKRITTPYPLFLLLFFCFFWGVGGDGEGATPGGLSTHSPVGTPSIGRVTRHRENQTGSLRAWNMANKHTREILLTSFIICPIPDLWPAGTQARNNDWRQSLTDLIIWPRASTPIKYRLQSHPSLLRAVLRSAYLAVLHSSALLALVS